MSDKISHKCIKCQSQYFDNEVDDYYCPPCNEVRIAIAKEVDLKMASRPPKRKTMSALQEYDASPKVRGFVRTTL